MSVIVLAGGLQTTVQDLGRFGHRQMGVGTSGALDGYSLRVGNWLAGNPGNAPALEITLQGPRLRFEQSARIAITGADIDASADGVSIPGWRPVVLPAGCELSLGPCRRGARAYLAVDGGFAVEMVLNSASTDLRAGFGGFRGRCLMAGDSLPTNFRQAVTATQPDVAAWWLDSGSDPDFGRDSAPIRILPGRDAIDPSTSLLTGSYRISAQSNRQGLRLQGAVLAVADGRERVSEPVAPGTVQLPPDGQPIVLLAEAQTIGGYPRVGHVIAADLPRLAQLRPGEDVNFEWTDATAARALACAQRQRLARIALAIEQRRRDA